MVVLGAEGMSVVTRVRFWWLRRQLRHPHEGTGPDQLSYTHSHLHHDLDHGHEIDACCNRPECRAFELHRVHPRRVV